MFHITRRHPWVVVGLGAIWTLTTIGIASAAPEPERIDERAVSSALELEEAFTSVADAISPSVVNIRVEAARAPNQMGFPFFQMPDQSGIVRGSGSGIILRSDGYILTNNHVIKDANRIEVKLQDGRVHRAKMVGADAASDLAVLRIDAKGLKPARFTSSEKARVGQFVIAVGSPFGLEYSVTTGVLSAKGRGGIGANEIEDYLQTDASINPGNSGGPLVDLRGNVLGINTMIIGRGSGIGFAIPAEMAQRVAEQLIKNGTVRRAWLGVTFQEMTPELAAHFDGEVEGGALINEVMADGPAAKAGLQPGDIIITVADSSVRGGRDLLMAVLRQPVGEKIKVRIRRGRETKVVTVITEERPGEANAPSVMQEKRDTGALGLALQPLTPELRRRLGYRGEGRVVVSGVGPGSDADRAGLRPGDVILLADHREVRAPADVRQALADGTALLFIERESHRFFQSVTRSSD